MDQAVDMVVLSVSMQPSAGAAELAEKLGIPLDADGWFEELDYNSEPDSTGRDGIYIAGVCQGPKDIRTPWRRPRRPRPAYYVPSLAAASNKDWGFNGCSCKSEPDRRTGTLWRPRRLQVLSVRRLQRDLPSLRRRQRLSAQGHALSAAGLEKPLRSTLDPWLCYYCGDCSERCPRGAEPGETMMGLRRWLTAQYDFTGISRFLYRSWPRSWRRF